VLDPNGEYHNAFDGLCDIRRYQVRLNDPDGTTAKIDQLKVPRACSHKENMIYSSHEINPGTAEKSY
jgi:hypothetical protein